MFKDAKNYSQDELLRMCQDFFGGLYWAWYEASVKTVGETEAHRILEQLADSFSDMEVTALEALWGGKFKNLHELTRALDVVHRVVAYEGEQPGSTPEWKMEDENNGHETINHCPIHATTPEHFKASEPTALCTIYCHNIGRKFYDKMGYTVRQDSWLSKGQTGCGFNIGRKVVD